MTYRLQWLQLLLYGDFPKLPISDADVTLGVFDTNVPHLSVKSTCPYVLQDTVKLPAGSATAP